MADHLDILASQIGGRAIHRRTFTKADGRPLRLYGYQPHMEAPLPQEGGEVAKGGELRWHPLRREWNVYAPHRQNRTFKPSAADDPLAPSRAGGAATEIPFTDFELAIFENKFTSLHRDAPIPQSVIGVESAVAKGHCDVVVYTPEATGNLHTIGQDKRRLLLSAWIDRYEDLFTQGCKFVLPFESRGDAVGVTLHHPHGQIYAFPFVPKVQRDAAAGFQSGYDLAKHMAACRDAYSVTDAGGIDAICPPYARFPYETYLVPRRPVKGPWDFTEDEAAGFAELLGEMTRRYDAFFGQVTPYMLSLHAAPVGLEDNWQFHAKFYPLMRAPGRIKYLASVEQSTGAFTVDVMPERAAKELRNL
ncbi:galactose-1-phosphate uridylyltransferase [Litorimonas cladophorae]|uniref:Galactose-1-phosphate uridylyltransferase n=1 Tax=Litorimonas cladophorae TaxID=1220491 RepID=A0A918NIK7_9PROT|nr:galactose-1-phosphate uridylyltransferase [Litorimonas cladophorae]GGX70196.1 galactose-1-phosphate uridylyltransferase [Litorimonas cladophorae]